MSPKLAVLEEIERIAGAKLDPALAYSLRFTTVSHVHLIRLRDLGSRSPSRLLL